MFTRRDDVPVRQTESLRHDTGVAGNSRSLRCKVLKLRFGPGVA